MFLERPRAPSIRSLRSTATTARSVAWALCAALCSLAAPAAATEAGSLLGMVGDEAGVDVQGATVTINGPALQGTLTTRTSRSGRFWLGGLPPGNYVVTIEHPQFRPLIENGVGVSTDSISIGRFEMTRVERAGDARRPIVRDAPRPGLDPARVTLGATFRPEFTDRVVTDRTPESLTTLVPAVVEGFGAGNNPSVRGGSPYTNLYLLDGMVLNDPVKNSLSMRLNFDAIAETSILTGGIDAEYGYNGGGVLNIVTRRGGDEFNYDASVYWAPSQLKLLDEGEIDDSTQIQANLTAGGPIIRKKLWFFVAAQYEDNTASTPLTSPVFDDVPAMPPKVARGFFGLGKLTFKPVSWQELSVEILADPSWVTNTLQEPVRHPDAERQRYEGGTRISVGSTTWFSPQAAWRTRVTFGSDLIESLPMSGDSDLAGHRNLETGSYTVNDSLLLEDSRFRLGFSSSISYFLDDVFGDHHLKLGLDGFVAWQDAVEDRTGGAFYIDRGASLPSSSVSGAGDPYQLAQVVEPLEQFVWSNSAAGYAQDVWRPFENLTIRAGVRVESTRLYADPSDGGGEVYNLTPVLPRIGLAWDPFGDGRTSIRVGYYQYADPGMLYLASFVGRGMALDVYEYNAATGKYDVFVRREGGRGGVEFRDNLRAPITHELLFGASREVFRDATLHADFIFRRKANMFEDEEINVQWNAAGDAATGYRNGRPELVYALSTPDNAFSQYLGLDLRFDKQLSENWSLLAGYTLSLLEGTVDEEVSYAFDNPRQAPYELGFLRNDVRHNGRVVLTYSLPLGLVAGVTARYVSGRPYSKLFLNELLNEYLDRRASRGYDPRELDDPNDDVELRYPDRFLVDARLVWRLQELTTQDMWIILEVRNALNQRPATLVEERALGPDSSTSFGQVLSRSAPMRATIAFRYRF